MRYVSLLMLGFSLSACRPASAPLQAAARPAVDNGACLPQQRGFLRARLRGALEADLDWKAALIECEGGARPDGKGIRVSLSGPLNASGQKLRIVFGLSAPPATAEARNVDTNLTLIVEGAQQLFSTLGNDKCSVDDLVQRPLASAGAGGAGDYEVSARGFCVGAASTLDQKSQVWMDRFDFTARIHLEESDVHGATRV
ncbi:MAG TPA: hypothetical protein VMI92_10575 [Steroidobacteraceae bacterium]|nr:hypothetical protein [Steroidobacteraceae bacterium]